MSRFSSTDTQKVAMVHQAIDKLFRRVTDAGHSVQSIGNITVTKRFNGTSGHHVHANTTVKLRFDESVAEVDAINQSVDSPSKY